MAKTDAMVDQGGTSLKQMPTSPAYEDFMHTSHPAYKGPAFKSLGTGVCLGCPSGGKLSSGHNIAPGNLNKVVK